MAEVCGSNKIFSALSTAIIEWENSLRFSAQLNIDGANLQLHQERLVIAVPSNSGKVFIVAVFGGQRVETGKLGYIHVVVLDVFMVCSRETP